MAMATEYERIACKVLGLLHPSEAAQLKGSGNVHHYLGTFTILSCDAALDAVVAAHLPEVRTNLRKAERAIPYPMRHVSGAESEEREKEWLSTREKLFWAATQSDFFAYNDYRHIYPKLDSVPREMPVAYTYKHGPNDFEDGPADYKKAALWSLAVSIDRSRVTRIGAAIAHTSNTGSPAFYCAASRSCFRKNGGINIHTLSAHPEAARASSLRCSYARR
jgi:hypothetical protein